MMLSAVTKLEFAMAFSSKMAILNNKDILLEFK